MRSNINNHIDKSLARGMAKRLIQDVLDISAKQNQKTPVLKTIKTLRSRKNAISVIAKSYGDLLIDVIAYDDYRSAGFITLEVGTLPDGNDRLVARVTEVHLGKKNQSKIQPHMNDLIAVDHIGYLCGMSLHSIQRLIQRNKVRTVADVIATIGLGSQWSAAAIWVRHDGSFMIPVPDGLICCGTDVEARDRSLRLAGVKGVNIRTFIGREDMGPKAEERWNRMVSAGALEDIPRALKRDAITSKQLEIFAIMAEEGRLWDERNAAATIDAGEAKVVEGP